MNGDYIRKLRHAAGLSQKELAEKLGYLKHNQPNGSHISRIENNHQVITPRLILAVKYVCEKTRDGEDISCSDPYPDVVIPKNSRINDRKQTNSQGFTAAKIEEALNDANDSITLPSDSDPLRGGESNVGGYDCSR